MGRKPHPGGIERMTFSFSRSVATKIKQMANYQGYSYTHFASMACMQYYRMKGLGSWMCEGTMNSLGCAHLNSCTTDTCEACGALSYDARAKRDRAKADKVLEEGPGTAIPIAEVYE